MIIQLATMIYITLTFINPSNAEATFIHNTRTQRFKNKTSKPCHVGIYRKALAEYS